MSDIRVNRGIEVNVNDAGDKIIINVEDQRFIDRFYGLISHLNKISDEAESESVKGLEDRKQLQKIIGYTEELMRDIDELFGEGCCRKVFGDVVPSFYLIADFFDQMTPIAEQYMNERRKMISQKYSNTRKGAKSDYHSKGEVGQD